MNTTHPATSAVNTQRKAARTYPPNSVRRVCQNRTGIYSAPARDWSSMMSPLASPFPFTG
jgi:hypothetical protein